MAGGSLRLPRPPSSPRKRIYAELKPATIEFEASYDPTEQRHRQRHDKYEARRNGHGIFHPVSSYWRGSRAESWVVTLVLRLASRQILSTFARSSSPTVLSTFPTGTMLF
jgi:hypothetical protein